MGFRRERHTQELRCSRYVDGKYRTPTETTTINDLASSSQFCFVVCCQRLRHQCDCAEMTKEAAHKQRQQVIILKHTVKMAQRCFRESIYMRTRTSFCGSNLCLFRDRVGVGCVEDTIKLQGFVCPIGLRTINWKHVAWKIYIYLRDPVKYIIRYINNLLLYMLLRT